jgi:hypothetical protein
MLIAFLDKTQDKQPVLPQDISPVPNATNALPSFIKSTTDTPTAPMNTDNNNNDPPNDDDDDDDETHHADVPLLVWDGTKYQLDYNHNHRPIYVWDGTTYTDIV